MTAHCKVLGTVFIASTFGCSTEECPRPKRQLSFGAAVECSFQRAGEADVSGVFTGTTGGFRVDDPTTGDSLEVSDLTAAVPQGTFVRARFWCAYDRWGGGGRGQFLIIDNLPSLDGVPNPTEVKARLWLVAKGGEGYQVPPGANPPYDLPFVLEEETACSIPSTSDDPYENDEVEVQRLIVSGDGFSVTAEPEQVASFVIGTGEHAGSYKLHNVNVTFYGLGYHLGIARNFTITRAD